MKPSPAGRLSVTFTGEETQRSGQTGGDEPDDEHREETVI